MKDDHHSPLALVACTDEWMCRSYESVFEQNGYSVVRSASGRRALDLARRAEHDVLLISQDLQDLDALELCRALRDDPLFDHSTPIIITATSHVTSQSRSAAYAAGAWEYCSQPVDMPALFLKLATFLRGRRELSTAQAHELVDRDSGFYTSFGLQHVAGQLTARALRKHEAFACLAFSPVTAGSDRQVDGEQESDFAEVTKIFRAQARKSDIVAHVGKSRLAILAPDTDGVGARLFFARLQRELDQASKHSAPSHDVRLHAGYCAVSDLAAANVNLAELVHRAESALDHVQAGGDGNPLVDFDELSSG